MLPCMMSYSGKGTVNCVLHLLQRPDFIVVEFLNWPKKLCSLEFWQIENIWFIIE